MAETIETRSREAFSGWPIIIGWLAMIIFAFHTCTHMVGAGDTWVALACGRHFINHGVNTVEPFSANSHKAGPTAEDIKEWPPAAKYIADKVGLKTVQYWHPTGWVNQNWLTHEIFYWLTHLSPVADAKNNSFNTLVYWKFAVYIITVICVYYIGRILGANPALAAMFACFAMFIGRSFIDIRPAGFSNMLVAVYILVLTLTTYRNYLYIWLIVPLAVFWCNLHGGYIYLFIMLVPFFLLHLFTILSKKATVSIYSILTWLGLYLAIYKFTGHGPFAQVALSSDKLLIFLAIFMAGSIVMLCMKSAMQTPLFYAYHIIAFLIIFFTLLSRLFPSDIPMNISQEMKDYVDDSQISFFIAAIAAVGIGLIITLLKDRLMTTTPAALFHTAGAGAVAFAASIIFNPFHLTNLTHTFVISVSEHAAKWREINEWHGAFEWNNPVGTSFPYFMLLIVFICGILLWLISRFLKPRLLKAPKRDLEEQKHFFDAISAFFTCVAAISIGIIVFTAFSLINNDAKSYCVCAVFIFIVLLSVTKSIHLIYLAAAVSPLVMLFSDSRQGFNGIYIYPFVLVPAYVITDIIISAFNGGRKSKKTDILFVIAASVAAIIFMMIKPNPFEISHFWKLNEIWDIQRIWLPQYELEGGRPLNYEYLFYGIYFVNIIAIIVWLLIGHIKRFFKWLGGLCNVPEIPPNELQEYQLPKVDLALIAIAGLTLYMAYKSRRFIPVAAYVACPVAAMFIDQLIRLVSASYNFYKNNRFAVMGINRSLQAFIVVLGAAVVFTLMAGWGSKFKRVYLDPWPTDEKLNSVFIRMTASDAKPFDACRFIKENKLSGKMFNYWTEGGFIAWGEEPDPNTGKIPLKLFMDGRAQAAYEPAAFDLWMKIMSGGPVYQSTARKRQLTTAEYIEVGKWVSRQLKDQNVWIVLMPTAEFDKPVVRGLEHSPEWQLVYVDIRQKLFIDITTPQGQKLFEGIFDGTTKYPTEELKEFAIGHNMLIFGKDDESRLRGLEHLIKSCMDNPNQLVMQDIIYAANSEYLRPKVTEFCREYFDNFGKHKSEFMKKDGYHHKMITAVLAAENLRKVANTERDGKLAQSYELKSREYQEELRELPKDKRW